MEDKYEEKLNNNNNTAHNHCQLPIYVYNMQFTEWIERAACLCTIQNGNLTAIKKFMLQEKLHSFLSVKLIE